jgi:hypothetical protein
MKQNITFLSEAPVKEPLLRGPWGPYGEKCSVSRANGWFIHSYFSDSPVKKLSHEQGKHMVTVHRAPRRQKAYIQWGAAWFPKRIIYDTAITTHVPRSLRHDTFLLGLGWPVPLASMCHGNPLQSIPYTPVTISHVTQSTDLQATLRYGGGAGFIQTWKNIHHIFSNFPSTTYTDRAVFHPQV